tara:strand:- start:36 stop:665 length:630 start_codon:yes stop_codon:yes gene_type:complete
VAKLNLEGIDDKELIQLVKMKIEKSKKVRDANKAIVNNLKTQLNKTKLPKNIVSPIVKKVDANLLKNASVASNLKKAQNTLKSELKALPKRKPDMIKALGIIKKDTNLAKTTKAPTSFGAAFRQARNAGLKTFMFKGKKYTTKLKTDTKKKSASPIMSKKTSSIKTTPSKFGGRISMSARLKEIDDEKKKKAFMSKIKSMAQKAKSKTK